MTAFGTPGIHGGFTQITIPTADPLTPLFYQCSVHAHMGGQIDVTITATESGGSGSGGSGSGESGSGDSGGSGSGGGYSGY